MHGWKLRNADLGWMNVRDRAGPFGMQFSVCVMGRVYDYDTITYLGCCYFDATAKRRIL